MLVPDETDPQPLTAEESAEKDDLLAAGFSNWSR